MADCLISQCPDIGADINLLVMPAKAGISGDGSPRIDQHRNGTGSAFCKRYNLTRLVLAEPHDDILTAIDREKKLKAWQREWKIKLIEGSNPDWRDLTNLVLTA